MFVSTPNRVSAPLRALLALSVFSLSVGEAAAQDRTTEAGEASITDPSVECSGYGYGPVTNALSQFPTILAIADLVPGDTNAAAKWAAIQPNVPNIAVKNISLNVSASVGGANYPATDPDCWWSFAQCTTPKAAGLQADIISVPEPQTLGYGFDDGPNCGHNEFYDFLASQNQKATMYYIGSNVMNFPLEAQRAVVDGHEICAHTWSHKYMTSLPSQNAFAELYYSIQSIKLVTGVTPTCWRPPYGDVDDRIRAIANGLGLRTIIWTYNSNDWEFGSNPTITVADVDANYQQMITDAGNGKFATAGTIILTHELTNFTMAEAIKFYPMLKSAFAHIVPVGVAYNKTNPYLETAYTLPSFAQYISGTTVTGATTINPADTIIASPAPALNVSGTTSGSASSTAASQPSGTSSSSAAAATTSAVKHSGALRLHTGGILGAVVLCLSGAVAMGL